MRLSEVKAGRLLVMFALQPGFQALDVDELHCTLALAGRDEVIEIVFRIAVAALGSLHELFPLLPSSFRRDLVFILTLVLYVAFLRPPLLLNAHDLAILHHLFLPVQTLRDLGHHHHNLAYFNIL